MQNIPHHALLKSLLKCHNSLDLIGEVQRRGKSIEFQEGLQPELSELHCVLVLTVTIHT